MSRLIAFAALFLVMVVILVEIGDCGSIQDWYVMYGSLSLSRDLIYSDGLEVYTYPLQVYFF